MESSTSKSKSTNTTTVTYSSSDPIYGMAISPSPNTPTQIAIGSFLEHPTNHINILSFSSNNLTPIPSLTFTHPYPPTKLLFHPTNPNLLASSGDFLRLHNLTTPSSTTLSSTNSAPITSFDWNPFQPRLIATSSIDTTCTIWDVENSLVETQLIAHDKEVHDISWGEAGVFASVSADGSVRIFDLRDKEHSTIIYESPIPLLRLAWNRQDLRYMAVTLMDTCKVLILDIRAPTLPVAELDRHVGGGVNAIAWAPQSARHLASGGDDGNALLWELPTVAGPNGIDPMLVYGAGEEINQLQWSLGEPDWIAVAFGNKVQMLKV